jgi:hypothetical protein
MNRKAGPGHPPAHTRFRKGQSGNPKGRPKGRKNRSPEEAVSAFDSLIDRTLTVSQDGVPRELTVEEGLQHRTYQDAIAGNRSAQHGVLKMILKREKRLAARKGPANTTVKYRTEFVNPANGDPALLILGIAGRDPVRKDWDLNREPLLLEPWAVQMALSRRSGGARLSEADIAIIKRCTRDADTLRWPRRPGE